MAVRNVMGLPKTFKLSPWNSLLAAAPQTPEQLVKVCEDSYMRKCGTLAQFFRECDADRKKHLFSSVIPKVWHFGSEIGTFFDGLSIDRLVPGQNYLKKELSREHICCLLVNMWIGTTKKEDVGFYSDLSAWCCSDSEFNEPDDPRIAYINSLMHYFELFTKLSPESRKGCVEFERVALEDIPGWSEDFENKILAADHVNLLAVEDGRIGDRPGEETEVDFANKNIGFGATATQEEIIFGCSPEMCVANLFVPTLGDHESVLIRKAFKVCDSEGYGTKLRTTPRDQSTYDWRKRCVVCLDALDFSQMVLIPPDEKLPQIPGVTFIRANNMLEHQLTKWSVDRELNKLFVGFSCCPPHVPIATGKWGCGVFAGHPVLKSLLQILSASAADRNLNFYLFGDGELRAKLSVALSTLDGCSLSDCYRKLLSDKLTEKLLT